jgi:hypothetical protein
MSAGRALAGPVIPIGRLALLAVEGERVDAEKPVN